MVVMRRRKREPVRTGPHLFETDPQILREFLQVQKEERMWRSSGQYFMALECQRRAIALQNENLDAYKTYLKTESLYCPTKKSPFSCIQ
tara:strand:- start:203 stop:469 length:267 start_codon:yes stop_codon:yes gene_type:complete